MDADRLSAYIADAMVGAGCDTAFGLPGGGNNLALVGACEAAGMRFVLTHTETAAMIMAGTHAQLTGAPMLCLVTRGPGSASAVNGCAQAMLDRQPVVLVTDCVPAADRSRVSHQWLDQMALFTPVAKWSGVVGDGDPRTTLDRALALACASPAGPVHLDFDPTAQSTVPPSPQPPPAVRDDERARLVELLGDGQRPVVLLGVGAIGAQSVVRKLVDERNIPVLTTYKARGVVPDTSPNYAGVLTGATIEAPVIDAADLIVAIGLDPIELIPNSWPYRAPLVSLTGWPADVDALRSSLELVGDLDSLVALAAEHLRDEWPTGAAERYAVTAAAELAACDDGGLGPYHVAALAAQRRPPRSIATVDAGAYMLVAMPTWPALEPGDLLTSSGLATMGFALPAAIGAALASPGRRVACFVGDGGLGMTLAELETIVRLDLDVTVVVLNDSTLSLIAVKQRPEGHGGERAVEYRPTDFAGIAAACGCPAEVVAERDRFSPAFERGTRGSGPYLLDVRIDPASYRQLYAAVRGPRGS